MRHWATRWRRGLIGSKRFEPFQNLSHFGGLLQLLVRLVSDSFGQLGAQLTRYRVRQGGCFFERHHSGPDSLLLSLRMRVEQGARRVDVTDQTTILDHSV